MTEARLVLKPKLQKVMDVTSPEWRAIMKEVPSFVNVFGLSDYQTLKQNLSGKFPHHFEWENDHRLHAMAISGMMGMHSLRHRPKDWTIIGYESHFNLRFKSPEYSYALFFTDLGDFTAFKLSL